VAFLEGNLGNLEKLYPTIPAIEVTIPHIHASSKFHFLLKNTLLCK